jgi:hypothetical protein
MTKKSMGYCNIQQQFHGKRILVDLTKIKRLVTYPLLANHSEDEMGVACSTKGGRSAYRMLMGKPEGKKPLGRTIRRSVDNIKMDFREIG